ncbi:hypothetical protein GKQ38_00255 [Candidatus Nanohaloarchaea archaeon]|nr:hypothetical protein GKQ38_00255 [Candidatus Nanohaloarchaea archaeon]
MIGNFSDDFGDLYVFFDEGEVENLESGPVTGTVVDADSPDLSAGSIEVVYEPDLQCSRPLAGRENEEGSVGEFQVVVGENTYNDLLDGEAYSSPAGDYQSLPSDADIRMMPPGETGDLDYLLEELDELKENYIK